MITYPLLRHRLIRILLCATGLICLAGCGQSADDADALAARDDGQQPGASADVDVPTSAQVPAGGETSPAPGAAPQRQRSISPRQRPAGDDDDEPQTRLIRTLDGALDEVDAGDDDVDKDDLRGILYEADRELRHVLGGKSKEAILRANRKPPTRYRHERRKPAVTPETDDADEDTSQEAPAP